MYTKTFETIVKYRVLPGIALLLGLSASNASAAVTEERASSNLTYKYDFDVNPSTLDYDNNGAADISDISAGLSVSDGKLFNNDVDALKLLKTNNVVTNNSIWNTGISSITQSWTLEFKIKLNSEVTGNIKWFSVLTDNSSPETGNINAGQIDLLGNSILINDGNFANYQFLLVDTFDPTQANTIRFAYDGDSKGYFLWVNGVLTNESLQKPFGRGVFEDIHSLNEVLILGNLDGATEIEWEMDYVYLDFTGGYAPDIPVIPEPTSASLAGLGLAMLLLRRRRAIS